jgi:uncharacterized protein (DUF433 family)
MLLENYFDFLANDDIRVKGTRIGIETILYDYLFKAKTAEEIANTYTSLNLEQVYATILYYLHNKETVEVYITDWLEWGEKMRAEQKLNPHPASERLKKFKVEKLANIAPCSNT